MDEQLSALYHSDCSCPTCLSTSKGDKATPPPIPEKYIRRAYQVVIDDGEMLSESLQKPAVRALINQTAQSLGTGLDAPEIVHKIPEKMMQRLREDIFVFSGFKTYHQLKEASELLRDNKGNVKSFDQFYKDVTAIRDKYNRNWLRAEYNFAVSSSQMAAKWVEQTQSGDEYDLQYRTAGDDKVRADHAALDGVTLPPSDPFWNVAYPPNGWNCRCSVVRTFPGDYPYADSERCRDTFGRITKGGDEIFRFNPGKEQVIFPPRHPYYGKRGYSHCLNPKFADQLDKGEECTIYREIDGLIIDKNERRQQYERLKNNPDYKDVAFDEATGGLKATHIHHNIDPKKGWYETTVQEIAFRQGYSVLLEREVHNVRNKKNNEGTWDGKPFEIGAIETGGENNIRNALKHCADKPDVKIAVLFAPQGVTLENFDRGLRKYNGLKGTSQWKQFDDIIIIHSTGSIENRKPD